MVRAALLAMGIVTTLTIWSLAGRSADDAGFPVAEIKWSGPFGTRGGSESTAFVPAASGFLSMPFMGSSSLCRDIGERIAAWIKQHPGAKVVPVLHIELGEEVRFTYVWIEDGSASLNLELIEDRCCPAEVMLVRDRIGELLVSRNRYDAFELQVKKLRDQIVDHRLAEAPPDRVDHRAHWMKAEQLESKGMLAEAIAEFAVAGMANEYEANLAWSRIARCYDRLNQYEDALYAYDKAISLAEAGDPFSQITLSERADLIARHEGADKAAASTQADASKCGETIDPCLELSFVYSRAGDHVRAATILEDGLQRYLQHQRLLFEGTRFVLEQNRTADLDGYWTNVQTVDHALCSLGSIMNKAGQSAEARRYTLMGLSASQTVRADIARRFNKQIPPESVEAGDFHCRLIMAQIEMSAGSPDAALREIEFARLLVESGHIQGGFVQASVAQAYAELREKFPDHAQKIPMDYSSVEKFLPSDFAIKRDSPAAIKSTNRAIPAAELDRRYPDSKQREVAERQDWLDESGLQSVEAWDRLDRHIELEMRYRDDSSAKLLLHCDRSAATYEFDYARGTLAKVDETLWTAQSTPIHVDMRVGSDDLRWQSDARPGDDDLTEGPLPCGKLFRFAYSPSHRAIAVASDHFDGNRETGCLQVFRTSDLGPISDRFMGAGQTVPYWSPDERYLFFTDPDGKWILGTGLPPLNPSAEDPQGQTCKIRFEPRWWVGWDPKRGPNLLCRYERANSPVLLMKALLVWPKEVKNPPRTGIYYRMEPASGRVDEVDEAVWEQAEGAVWKQHEMIGAGQVLEAHYDGTKLLRLDQEIPVAGSHGIRVYVAPELSRAVVLSTDGPKSEFFYQQVFRLPEGVSVGETVKLRFDLLDEGPRYDEGPPRPWAWFPNDSHIVYRNWERKAVLIVPIPLDDNNTDVSD